MATADVIIGESRHPIRVAYKMLTGIMSVKVVQPLLRVFLALLNISKWLKGL